MADRIRARLASRSRPTGPATRSRIILILVAGLTLALVLTLMNALNRLAGVQPRTALVPVENPVPAAPGDGQWQGRPLPWPDAVREYSPEADFKPEHPELIRILLELEKLKPEEIQARLDSDRAALLARLEAHRSAAVEPDARSGALARFLWENPDAARGKLFAVEGSLLETVAVALPVSPGLCRLGVVKDRVTGQQILFFSLSDPPPKGSGARVEGVFLNLYRTRDDRFGARMAAARVRPLSPDDTR